MESFTPVRDERLKKAMKKMDRNYTLSQEGLFDFFRKKKQDGHMTGDRGGHSNHDHDVDYNQFRTELLNASKVSIHLYTVSVDEEIKLLEELIQKGLPIFQKDVDRLEKCFKFILANKTSTIDKLDKLVDISYLDSSYRYNPNLKALDFNTFIVSVIGMASSKELQKEIGVSHELVDLVNSLDEIGGKSVTEMTDEEVVRYEKMYFLEEAIPCLDEIIPKKLAAGNQKRIYLEKGDPKLKRLIDLNVELLEGSRKILSEDSADNNYNGGMSKLWKLADNADKVSHPLDMGDDFGVGNIPLNYVRYQRALAGGFESMFIQNYTAH
jgi:predicted aldo/keto reductase-like oxidoreductase